MQDVFHSQSESQDSSAILSSTKASTPKVPQTLTEKIVQKYSIGLAPGKVVQTGDYVTIAPHHCMTHDNSMPVLLKFSSIGATKIHDSKQPVLALDHNIQDKSELNLTKYRRDTRIRCQTGSRLLSSRERHWPPDHGGRRIRVARNNDCC